MTSPERRLSAWRVTVASSIVWVLRDRENGADVVGRYDEANRQLTQFSDFNHVARAEIVAALVERSGG